MLAGNLWAGLTISNFILMQFKQQCWRKVQCFAMALNFGIIKSSVKGFKKSY